MYNKHQNKFFLPGVAMFNVGGITLPLFNLDWLSWSMIISAVILWCIGMKAT